MVLAIGIPFYGGSITYLQADVHNLRNDSCDRIDASIRPQFKSPFSAREVAVAIRAIENVVFHNADDAWVRMLDVSRDNTYFDAEVFPSAGHVEGAEPNAVVPGVTVVEGGGSGFAVVLSGFLCAVEISRGTVSSEEQGEGNC